MTLPDISALGTLGIGAALAAVVAGWQQVKGFLQQVAGLLIVTSEFHFMGAQAGRVYCQKHLKPTPTAFRVFEGRSWFIRPRNTLGIVFREVLGNRGRLFWKGCLPVWVSSRTSTSGEYRGPDSTTFRYIRGTFHHDRLATAIADALELTKSGEDRFEVRRMAGRSGKSIVAGMMANSASSKGEPAQVPAGAYQVREEGRLIGWREEDIGERKLETEPLDRLALSHEVVESVETVKRWFNSKDWYSKRQIPWRYGLGLYGAPGTGKSSLVKALAQHLRIPIYLLDISTMDNEEFHDAYQTALRNTPAIVLIEDIDAVFDGRENIASEKGKGLTYDCLLNVVSGVESSDGLLLVVTTNHIDKVDPALGVPQGDSMSSRPGRIDRMVEMRPLDTAGKRKVATRILAGCHESWVDHVVAMSLASTGAQFEDRCAALALRLYWSEKPNRPAPHEDFTEEAA